VYLLPLTRERTTLGMKDVSEKVNVEVDFLVKTAIEKVEAMMHDRPPAVSSDTSSDEQR
jgi:riboflavin synthase alpha subunit